MSLLFLFLDGVGLGDNNPEVNPFVQAHTPFLKKLLGGKLTNELEPISTKTLMFKGIDAKLGHDGLPQSATGQTALLTGKNAAAIMKGHYGPWPGPTLKKELDQGTLFSELLASGKTAQLVNLYPPGFFAALESGKQKMNVPVYAATKAGLKLRRLEQYQKGEAISIDLTGGFLTRYGNYESMSPYNMGKRLAKLAKEVRFSFFDYWPSDAIGHKGNFKEAVKLIEKLDAFLQGIFDHLEITLLITSDHGNIEDKSVKTHTLADVPLIVIGNDVSHFNDVKDIRGVPQSIRKHSGL